MKTNIPLYLQYIVARYFSAKTGSEQLSWILERELIGHSLEGIKTLTMHEFDSEVRFFPDPGIAQVYSLFTEYIFKHFLFPRNFNALIANMILYHVDNSVFGVLQEPEKVKTMFEEAKYLLKLQCRFFDRAIVSHINIAKFIQTLQIMSESFEICQVKTEQNLMPRMAVIGYTDMEEMWLVRQFGRFQRQFLSVQAPVEYLQEAVDYMRTQRKTRKSFVPTWIMMTTERIARVLKMHPGKECTPLIIVLQKNLEENIGDH